MAIIRWDPFREMTQVQNQFNRVADQVWGGRQESWLPAVDVFDTKDAVVLKAELAGMDPDDIAIEVEDNVLTIKGERKFEEKVDEERYYRVERRFGSFQRSLALPQGVKAGEIQAGYEDGILTVSVPKAEEERYYRVERRFGSFQRSLALPQGVKAGEIQAGYEDGILTVSVPKAEEE